MTHPDLFTATLEPDPCARKHGGDECSRAAFEKGKPNRARQRQAVYEAVYAAGLRGITCAELAERWGVPMHTISGRFTELAAANRMRKDGTRKSSNGNPGGVWRAQG